MFSNRISVIFIEASVIKCVGKKLTSEYKYSFHLFSFVLSFFLCLFSFYNKKKFKNFFLLLIVLLLFLCYMINI